MRMERHITEIALAGEDLYQRMCDLGLAFLWDESTEKQRRRCKHETLQSVNKLKSQLDRLVEAYDLTGVQERVKEQLI